VVGLFVATGSAFAQQVTPTPLNGENFQALGLRAGAFIAYPSVETGFEATDNVFNDSEDRRYDVGYYIEPSLRVESEWVRHQVNFEMSSRHLFYFRTPSEDTTEVDLRGGARVGVLSTTSVEFDGGYSLEQEGRGSVDVPGAASSPPNEHRLDGSVALTHQFNRIEARLEGNAEYNFFEDASLVGGGVQSNQDRNYYEVGGELRVGYDISPKLQPFVEVGYSVRRHEQEVDDNGLLRNSQGYSAAAGVAINVSSVITGEVAVGYVDRDFVDGALEDVQGFTVNGDLAWQLSPLTSFNLSASTNVDETSTGSSAGAIAYRVGVGVDHALRRHFLFGADASYTLRDFSGSALSEETLYLAAGFTYHVHREVALTAGYGFTQFDSSTPGSDYTSNSATIGLLWQR
jgi:hypothetical protein